MQLNAVFRIPLCTGYRPEKQFSVPMGTGYRLEKNFGYRWVPEKFSLMPTPASDLLTTQQAMRF